MSGRLARRSRAQSAIHGVLLVDKSAGPTSHDVVQKARRAFGTSRVGHTGTLDPFATGLLPIAIGAATSLVPYLTDGDKTYRAVVRLGVETTTGDSEGDVVFERGCAHLDTAMLVSALAAFVGELDQVPPLHSAIKVEGKRLFEYARAGEPVEVPVRRVRVDSLDLLAWDPPFAHVQVRCGKGFYVRSLACDWGRALGVGGHLVALRRLRVGALDIQDSISDQMLTQDELPALAARVLSGAAALAHLRDLGLDEAQVHAVRCGQKLAAPPRVLQLNQPGEVWLGLDLRGALVALLQLDGDVLRVVRGYVVPPPPEAA